MHGRIPRLKFLKMYYQAFCSNRFICQSVDVNTYQQKKNLAQGMMDLALLSANANQLRYVLESANTHPYYYPSLAFISLSIIFQVPTLHYVISLSSLCT